MLMKQSTNEIMHVIKNKYYICNSAVGKHKKGIVNLPSKYINCKNCINRLNKEYWRFCSKELKMKIKCNDGIIREFNTCIKRDEPFKGTFVDSHCNKCNQTFGCHDTKFLKPEWKKHICKIT